MSSTLKRPSISKHKLTAACSCLDRGPQHHSLLKERKSHFNWRWGQTGKKKKKRRQPYTFLLNSSHAATTKTSTIQHAHYARLSNMLTVKLRPLLPGNFNKYTGWYRKRRTGVKHTSCSLSEKGEFDWGVVSTGHRVKTTQFNCKCQLCFLVKPHWPSSRI